jgi:hypothetical protein
MYENDIVYGSMILDLQYRPIGISHLISFFHVLLTLIFYNFILLSKIHHDYIPHQRAGPRVLTVLLYLSDADAGGTNFPMLNRTIQPRKGRALIFPNVLDSGTYNY